MSQLNISRALIAKRKEKGITQDELANYIGVSKASVSKWETGQSYPDITFLPQLAAYFNITVDELIGYEPQMRKEDIGILYLRLCKDFTNKPFYQVMGEVRELTKKYYSCFPLILNMGILMVNHQDIAAAEEREPLINEALELFVRIQAMSKKVEICRQAKNMEAVCYILLNQPAQIIDLLQDGIFPMVDETALLAQGQMMSGKLEEATETLQIGAYQMLVSLVQSLTGLLQTADISQMKEINNRILALSKSFELEALSPSAMFSVYFTQAQVYLTCGEEDAALTALEQYVELATRDIFPLVLRGDAFFNRITRRFSELNFGINAPRADATIKSGLVAAVKDNPIFSPLKENARFRLLVDRLSLLEG